MLDALTLKLAPVMTYVITRGIGVAVVEMAPTLESALERAGQLVSEDFANVAIHDEKGNRISGDDLVACYLGVMKLTPDLSAVDASSSDP
jgi:hypothetical protein